MINIKSAGLIFLHEKRYFKNSILNFLHIFLSYFNLTRRSWGIKCPKCKGFVESRRFQCESCGHSFIITYNEGTTKPKSVYSELIEENCEFKRKEAQGEFYNKLLIEYMKRAKILPDGKYINELPFEGIYYKITIEKTSKKSTLGG